MTALKKYEKLEAPGLWRETFATQRREVYVSFGNTSLMIRNNADEPLSHWSFPAIARLNPGKLPAIFSPNADASETLEIDDATMIEAIEKVQAAIDRRRPHPGRLRLAIFAALVVLITASGIFWLPGAIERHTIRVVPFETRRQIGNQLLQHIAALSGKTCTLSQGDRVLRKLEARLLKDPRGEILILAEGLTKIAHLPGQIFLLNRTLVEDHEQPEVAAGYIVLEQLRRDRHDPLADLLQHAGGISSFRLLTTGNLDEASLRSYARHILVAKRAMPEDGAILKRIEEIGFSSSPLAFEIDISGETTLTLIEADPYRGVPYDQLLSDADWVRLQGICGG